MFEYMLLRGKYSNRWLVYGTDREAKCWRIIILFIVFYPQIFIRIRRLRATEHSESVDWLFFFNLTHAKDILEQNWIKNSCKRKYLVTVMEEKICLIWYEFYWYFESITKAIYSLRLNKGLHNDTVDMLFWILLTGLTLADSKRI